MQSIPVDMNRLGVCLCVVPPEPKMINAETGETKTDRDGVPVYTVGVAVRQRDRRGASVIEVSVSGEPSGVGEGDRVVLGDLEAFVWTMGDRHGVSYRAAWIRPATGLAGVSAPGDTSPKTTGGGAK